SAANLYAERASTAMPVLPLMSASCEPASANAFPAPVMAVEIPAPTANSPAPMDCTLLPHALTWASALFRPRTSFELSAKSSTNARPALIPDADIAEYFQKNPPIREENTDGRAKH